MADLLFAFTVAKHVKSNAIVYAKGGATVGIGAGQMTASMRRAWRRGRRPRRPRAQGLEREPDRWARWRRRMRSSPSPTG